MLLQRGSRLPNRSFHVLRAAGFPNSSLFLMLTAVAVVTPPPDSAVHNVWWTEELRLADLASIPERMQTPFEDKLEVYNGEHSATIANCADYLRYAPLHYEPRSDLELRVLRSWGTDCWALNALKEVAPAKIALLRDFRLDTAAPRYLPPELATALSKHESRAAQLADEQGLTWQQHQHNLKVLATTDTITVQNGPERTQLEIYARGDFNHDGIEDILIRDDSSIVGGTYSDSRLFLLTRTTPDARLKILKKYE
jgi:hypothetical protein